MSSQDQIRVLRIVEYVGDRAWVERQVAQSLHGTREVSWKEGKGKITSATLHEFPEVLEKARLDVQPENKETVL